MLDAFRKFFVSEGLFGPKDKVLLAVSGGMDSVAMASLFHEAGISFGIVHCNFQLRGTESDEDEVFVEKMAKKYRVPFYCKKFFTTEEAEEKGISIQMAARELRYRWFEEVRKKEKYDFIATAHHLDDQIETFFINLLRSTGIAGMHGIVPKQEHLVRPMLFTFRKDIEAYIRKKRLSFREDSSNTETKYLRNKIRHEILPVLEEMNPSLRQTLTGNIQRLKETEIVFSKTVEAKRKKIVHEDKSGIKISLADLMKCTPVEIFAFEILSAFGFNEQVIRNILDNQGQFSGKVFYSSSHRLIRDRKELIINSLKKKPITGSSPEKISIPEKVQEIKKPIHLVFTKKVYVRKFEIDLSKEAANFDLHKITFPLELRKWKKGDTFSPYGFNRKKKLSDYFIDAKLSIPEKENAWLLCSGENILWIVGHRIDHRYRVTSQTKEVLHIKWFKGKNI